MNNDIMQYSNNRAMIIFRIFPCFMNRILNNEPNNAQAFNAVNPTNAKKTENSSNTGI